MHRFYFQACNPLTGPPEQHGPDGNVMKNQLETKLVDKNGVPLIFALNLPICRYKKFRCSICFVPQNNGG
ncbi:unnamed protein product, partial [Cercopithifilaria johnstoni]